MYLKRLLSILTAVCLTLGIFGGAAIPAWAAEEPVTYVSNVVLLVDFQDTDHEKHSFLWGTCPEKDPTALVETLSGENPRSMTRFLSNISYGQLQVTNVFPQYRDGVMMSYRLSHNAEYYVDEKMIGTGTEIIRELLPRLREDLDGKDLDRDGDGVIDNLTLILPCDENSRDSLFYSHKATYGGADIVNGLRIGNYNVLTEHALNQNGSAVAIHEFLHTRGYPDLYDNTRSGTSGETGSGSSEVTKSPVWLWDIMSSTFLCVRYPLAYLRSAITKWFDIPTVMESRTGYSLYAASAADEKTKDNQAVILKTDYSDTEFFVLEYRKRGDPYSNTDYDCGIPGSGLIVYRVNLSRESNYSGAPYLIYVFRPGDSFVNGYEQGGGQMENSFLSAESGRTVYGSGDPAATLSDGAITYSDGTNSGIVIHNVGKADGDTISFDITFPERPEDGWNTEGFAAVDDTPCLAMYADDDGTIYHLLKKSGSVRLYQFADGSWEPCADPLPADAQSDFHLVKYNGSFYAAYKDSRRAQLLRLNGQTWETVYTSVEDITQLDVASDSSGIYLACTAWDAGSLSVTRCTAAGTMQLGPSIVGNAMVYTPSIAVENGTVAVMYCDFPADFSGSALLVVKRYDGISNTWSPVGRTEMRSTNGLLGMCGGKLYLLKNSVYGDDDRRCFVYTYDMAAGGDWAQLGGAYADANVVSASLCFPNGVPTILYHSSESASGHRLCAVQFSENAWAQLGDSLTSSTVFEQALGDSGDRLYAAYITDVSHQVYLKSYGLSTAHSHVFGPWTAAKKPGCTESGQDVRICTVCGKTEIRETAALGHSWNEAAVEIAPTYLAPGRQSVSCKICGAVKDVEIIPQKEHPFVDVIPGAESYYYAPVLWALDREITKGTDDTHFSPFAVCTRGQVVTFLWRAAGSPEPETAASPFSDVQEPGAYYYKAVLWAVEHGITNGTDPSHFTPDATVTRGQFVTFLWRLSGKPVHSGKNPFGDIAPGPDSFYYDAVLWACEDGITNGVGDGSFAPLAPCQRGQTVTFLHRYYMES